MLAPLRFLCVVLRLDLRVNLPPQRLFVERIVFIQPAAQRLTRVELGQQRLFQPGDVPLFFEALRRDVLADDVRDDLFAQTPDHVGNLVCRHQLVALLIDDLALVVRDVVVLEQVLANVEVSTFDLSLRLLDGVGDHPVFDCFPFFQAQRLHDAANTIGREDPHQIVFHRQIEARRAIVALTARATSQLIVYAARFVSFGTDDVQTTRVHYRLVTLLPLASNVVDLRLRRLFQSCNFSLPVAAEHDVGAATRHVRCNRDDTRSPRLRNDFGLAFVLFRVQHAVRNLALLEFTRKTFGRFDRCRANQHRSPFGNALH